MPPYPFQRIRRIDGRDTGVIAIIAPFYDLDYYRVSTAYGALSDSGRCLSDMLISRLPNGITTLCGDRYSCWQGLGLNHYSCISERPF